MSIDLRALIIASLCALALRLMLPGVQQALSTAAEALVVADANADSVVETVGALIAHDGMRGALAYAFSPSREYISCFLGD